MSACGYIVTAILGNPQPRLEVYKPFCTAPSKSPARLLPAMRLIRASTKELVFFISSNPPPYVILSHTWGKAEILFEDFVCGKLSPEASLKVESYRKLEYTCAEAIRMNVEYCWIDNCCIDKSNSAELQESINSMYKWYQRAIECFVYLADVHEVDHEHAEQKLKDSRWFTRGWTVQELIAPACISFYDSSWEAWGVLRRSNINSFYAPATDSENDLNGAISRITGIPRELLWGKTRVERYSIAQRMSWSAERETTVPEDIAYSLLGIFQIAMPMLYGEGQHTAFQRLQEEILKKSTDHTIFAWRNMSQFMFYPQGILASHPSQFKYSSGIVAVDSYQLRGLPDVDRAHYSMTNRGLDIEASMLGVPLLPDHNYVGGIAMVALRCKFSMETLTTQLCVSSTPTDVKTIPQQGFIGILVARQSNGPIYSRINAAQFVYTENWGLPQRIVISRTETDQVNFSPSNRINHVSSTKWFHLDLEVSNSRVVYVSHARPVGRSSLDGKEMNKWTDIGWTKGMQAPIGRMPERGYERFQIGTDKFTVWLGKMGADTFMVDEGHGSPPEDHIYEKCCGSNSFWMRTKGGSCIAVGVTSGAKMDPFLDQRSVFFIRAIEIDSSVGFS
ncbi:hypothetical protein HYALB_00000587 [Hymenoscyphus albidus]|uniref:Heterokaryon incompatibility domain-containing protein n=1 Tax=Hymenoscyphus albidus TaxID=595503 RepID=A0A9N9LYH8_9HELO|nr:hypothetical protein HYALB_00000587 [Hymenoscyphus albidus]